MEYLTEKIEVGTNIYRSVEYAWRADDEKVTIFMRYEGKEIDPAIEIRPPQVIGNDKHALTIVRLYAIRLYDKEKEFGD